MGDVQTDVVPSEKVAVQLKSVTAPTTTEVMAGAIEIDLSVVAGVVTVRSADADGTPAIVTIIVADPGATPVNALAAPKATFGFEEVKTGEAQADVVPSDSVAVQLKFSAAPTTSDAIAGAIEIDLTVIAGAVTVRIADADGAPATAAVMLVTPGATPVNALPAPKAMFEFEEVKIGETQTDVVPSDDVAVQLKFKTAPTATDAVVGAIEIDFTVVAGAVTVNSADADGAPTTDAVIVANPGAIPVTTSLDSAAIAELDELYAGEVHTDVVPSDSVSVQTKLSSPPATIDAVAGAIEIDFTLITGAITTNSADAGDAPATDAVMVTDPGATPVTEPPEFEATLGFDELYTGDAHAAAVPLDNVSTQVKVSIPPTRTDAFPGAIEIDDSVGAGALTVSSADAGGTPASDAVIVADPGATPVATLPEVEATPGFDELYTGEAHAAVVPSESVAVQLKLSTPPTTTDAVPGAIDIAESVGAGAITVSSAEAGGTPATDAVIVAAPGAAPVTTLLEMEATPGFDDVYTGEAHADVVPSESVAVQVKLMRPPTATDAVAGVIAIDASVATGAVTVSNADAGGTPAIDAVIVALPGATPVTALPEMEATPGFDDV